MLYTLKFNVLFNVYAAITFLLSYDGIQIEISAPLGTAHLLTVYILA